MWLVLLMILGIFSYWDMREKRLSIKWLLVSFVFSFLYNISEIIVGDRNIWFGLCALFPGVLLWMLSLLMKGRIGGGDGPVLILIGNLAGAKNVWMIFWTAVMLSFVYSCILLFFFRKGRQYSFPFIPFYFGGAVLVWLFSGNLFWGPGGAS